MKYLPKVRDRDDDQQVQEHSNQRNKGEQDVDQHSFIVRICWCLAGVVQLWKTEFISLHCLWDQVGGCCNWFMAKSYGGQWSFIPSLPMGPKALFLSAFNALA